MLQLNTDTLNKVVTQARADVAGQPDAAKWDAAITRALALLETNPWIERTDDGLLIAGSEGTYSANGSCQCPAYRAGMTHCKHRVLSKLIKRYDEAVAAQAVRPSYDEAVSALLECF